MMTNQNSWHERMLADLIAAGLSKRTQTAYLRAVRQLSEYYNGTQPEQLREQQVKDYLLWMRTEKRAAPGTLKIAIGGLLFFLSPDLWTGLESAGSLSHSIGKEAAECTDRP